MFPLLRMKTAIAICAMCLPLATCDNLLAWQFVTVESSETKTVYKMHVDAAPEPKPIQQIRLNVPAIDQVPGNAALFYLRPLGERFFDSRFDSLKKHEDDNDFFDLCDIETDLSESDLDRLKKFSVSADYYTKHFLENAIKQNHCDWGIYPAQMSGNDFIETPLPAVQNSRQIARFLAIRGRYANFKGDYKKSIQCLTMGYELADDVRCSPFIVAQLVAMACEGITHNVAVEFIARPGSPNLYFAYLTKNDGNHNLRRSFQLEQFWPLKIHPILLNLENQELTEAQWNKKFVEVYQKFMKLTEFIDTFPGNGNEEEKQSAKTFVMNAYPGAKKRLIASGYDPKLVEQMPTGKVLLIDTVNDLKYFLQKQNAIHHLPFEKFQQFSKKLDDERTDAAGDHRLGAIISGAAGSALSNVRVAAERIRWQTKSLQVIEALRLHAAKTGSFPKSLSDMEWPAPKNPITGKDFSYQLDGKKAIIDSNFPKNFHVSYRYEIQLRKQRKKDKK